MEKRQATEFLEYLLRDRNIEGTIYEDALNMAIEALKAQLLHEDATSDLISRQQTIDALDCISGVEEVLRSLPSTQPETHWIPVSERLPKEYGEYLVTKRTIGWNCEEYDVNDIAYFDDDGFHKADRIIAWMPLPEVYKPNKK